jgi:hypothetical protein
VDVEVVLEVVESMEFERRNFQMMFSSEEVVLDVGEEGWVLSKVGEEL